MARDKSGKAVKKSKKVEKEVEKEVKGKKGKKGKKEEKGKKKNRGEHLKNVERKGRPVGVVYVVPNDNKEEVQEFYNSLDENVFALRTNLKKFIETGSKAAAKNARGNLRDISKEITDFRAAIQEAKEAIEMQEKDDDDDDDNDDDD